MKKAFAIACTAMLFACSNGASDEQVSADGFEQLAAGISSDNLKRHISVLASDEYEGRAPGSRGEQRTLAYLAEQYAELGLRPGNPDGTYVQAVPLFSSTVTNAPHLQVRLPDRDFQLNYIEDFMGWTLRQSPSVTLTDAELVFVGYGVVAPEYEWNDFKDVDVSGKVVVMLVGDPPLEDDAMFGGRAMTYYGRWTYKFEIAAAKGAAGAIVIHQTEAAGYPWAVVSNSWSGEQFDVVRENGGDDRCSLEAWVTTEGARRIFSGSGRLTLSDAYAAALRRDFQPTPLGVNVSCRLTNRLRSLRSYNAVALLEGSDDTHKDELVLFTAHWDHLGVGLPVENDSIYNGAVDNASGVAATLEIARALHAQRDKLKRSVLFLNTTAEESGLIGAKHYAQQPLHPLDKTVAVINIDGINVWGRTRDVVVVGHGFSNLDDYLARAIESHGRALKPDPQPEKGYYYRSDHFPFAKRGIPALYADSGPDFRGRPEGWGKDVETKYRQERYHKPQDEMDTAWDLDGASEDLEAFVRVAMMLAGTNSWPVWSDKSEFRNARESSSR